MPKLGVNIDHVATLRQARREFEPDPIQAALKSEQAGAHAIVAHLREDRRHINDQDVLTLRKILKKKFNLEMSTNKEIVQIASSLKPDQATLVPEKREEITTEGGLDVAAHFTLVKNVVGKLQRQGILVSLFIDPRRKQIAKAAETGAEAIELHTGSYARAKTKSAIRSELETLKACTAYAKKLGLIVHAGHGLNYQNALAIAQIKGIEELNIGHSIIARAVFVGLPQAVKEMLKIIR